MTPVTRKTTKNRDESNLMLELAKDAASTLALNTARIVGLVAAVALFLGLSLGGSLSAMAWLGLFMAAPAFAVWAWKREPMDLIAGVLALLAAGVFLFADGGVALKFGFATAATSGLCSASSALAIVRDVFD